MCGRFTLIDLADFVALFPWVKPPEQFAARYNIAPSQPILMLSNRQGGTMDHAIWGFIPEWAKPAESLAKAMINARAETIAHKPTFRSSFRHQRSIIPASGFYEWKTSAAGKRPHYITHADASPMLFAGLWEDTPDGAGGEIRTACIITTPANETMRSLHDRMPAILSPADAATWIKTSDSDAPELLKLLQPAKSTLSVREVSRLVNSPGNDRRECIDARTLPQAERGLFGEMD